jgi:hypothetical protein
MGVVLGSSLDGVGSRFCRVPLSKDKIEPIADEIDKLIGGEAVGAQHLLCAALRVAIGEQMKRPATIGLGQAATDRIAGRHGARVIGHAELAKRIMRPRLRRGVGSQGTAAVRFEPSNPNELLTFALRNP